MKILPLKLILLSVCFLSFGCLQTPLLNHANASNEASLLDVKKECPLIFPQNGLCASIDWTKLPTDEDTGEFTLRFWQRGAGAQEKGPYVTPPFDLNVKLWMPSMGHGSSPVKLAHEKDGHDQPLPGVYKGTDVFFSMSGEWEIWVQLKKDRKVVEQDKIDIRI